MGWEPVGRCIAASEQHSHTTRRLVEDSQGDKRVFTGMHEILKAKIGELEDTINVNDKALGGAMEDMSKAMEDMSKAMEDINANGKAVSGDIDEVKGRMAAIEDDMKESNKVIESRMAEIEDDMKEVKSNMKEIKDLLVQLVGVTRENKEE